MEDIAFGEKDSISKSSGITSIEDIEKIQTAARGALKDKLRNTEVENEEENIEEVTE